ncbi:hypothetical protein DL769_003254 [Monosporascus sp. CRB-8-3]|nr:hypothetical protein DL769_003254 [Monosporascus sp. CRB-8-3]
MLISAVLSIIFLSIICYFLPVRNGTKLSDQLASQGKTIQDLIGILNSPPPTGTPLAALADKLERFFALGPDVASMIFSRLLCALTASEYTIEETDSRVRVPLRLADPPGIVDYTVQFPWNSCKLATTLVLVLGAPVNDEILHKALKYQSRSLGGLPTPEMMQRMPSACLGLAFRRAKAAALREGKTTLMGVGLVDAHIFELSGRGRADEYFSFAHSFSIGVGPDGVRIWQAWGKHGYQLDAYIADGHARLRTWDEAEQFVRDFDKLVSIKGPWSTKCNELYKKLFLVDINQLCGPKRVERPVTPMFQPWVRIMTLENVTCGDISKFFWVLA